MNSGRWVGLLLEAVLAGLVGYRLWRLVAVDTVTARLRDWLTARTGRSPVAALTAEWLACPWCAGWWIAGAVTAGVRAAAGWDWWWLVTWPVASVVVGWVASAIDRDDR